MIGAIAERVAQGAPIDEADARAILGTHDLIAIGAMADDVRRRMHDVETTFLRVFEIHVDAVPASLPAGLTTGEIRLVGRPASAEAALSAVRDAARLAGKIPLGGFALADLLALGGDSPDALERVCAQLRAAGLAIVAEAAVDGEADPQAAIAAARRAGLLVPTLVVQSLPPERRVEVLMRARALQESLGGFRALAPLPRTIPDSLPTTGYDDVKVLALARVLVTDIPSIQVDWPLYGPKLAQFALTVGADDVDRVAAVETGLLGRRRSAIEEIQGNIRAAGLEPRERNALWEAITS